MNWLKLFIDHVLQNIKKKLQNNESNSDSNSVLN